MTYDEEDEELVLAPEDVDEVLEDDGEAGEPMEEMEMPADAEPMIKDDEEDLQQPEKWNAWTSSCKLTIEADPDSSPSQAKIICIRARPPSIFPQSSHRSHWWPGRHGISLLPSAFQLWTI